MYKTIMYDPSQSKDCESVVATETMYAEALEHSRLIVNGIAWLAVRIRMHLNSYSAGTPDIVSSICLLTATRGFDVILSDRQELFEKTKQAILDAGDAGKDPKVVLMGLL